MLAVNDAMLQLPWAAAVFSLDHRWIRSRLDKLASFTGQKFFAVQEFHSDCWQIPQAVYLKRAKLEGLSDQPDTVHLGGCSGYAALNLACHLGAKRITLYGFDLTPGRAFESEHPEQRHMYRSWARQFRTTLPFLRDRSINVVNASRESIIDAFPKISPDG